MIMDLTLINYEDIRKLDIAINNYNRKIYSSILGIPNISLELFEDIRETILNISSE